MKPTTFLVSTLALSQACLLPDEAEADRLLNLEGPNNERAHELLSMYLHQEGDSTGMPIGTEDRFATGLIAPRGIGTEDRDMKTILSVDEVTTGLRGLHNHYSKDVEFFTGPQETAENRTMHGIVIGKRPRVFLLAGMHGRERGAPDHLLYFLADLLYARAAGTGVTYGEKRFKKKHVERALSVGIVAVPLANPDGAAYDAATNNCWRKNRNGPGVDVDRNFDAWWNYTEFFSPDARRPPASDVPMAATYHGPKPMSEMETQNLKWVMHKNKAIAWLGDLHSTGGKVMHGIGADEWQFIRQKDVRKQKTVTVQMCDSMNAAGGIKYRPMQNTEFYSTSGSASDYMTMQYLGRRCGARRVTAIKVQFGRNSDSVCPFYPNTESYHESMRQVGAGLMELLLAAEKNRNDPIFKCKQNSEP